MGIEEDIAQAQIDYKTAFDAFTEMNQMTSNQVADITIQYNKHIMKVEDFVKQRDTLLSQLKPYRDAMTAASQRIIDLCNQRTMGMPKTLDALNLEKSMLENKLTQVGAQIAVKKMETEGQL